MPEIMSSCERILKFIVVPQKKKLTSLLRKLETPLRATLNGLIMNAALAAGKRRVHRRRVARDY
jgi:hypothetical protein